MRVGVVGTSYWAMEAHAKGVLGCPDAELVGFWGRDRQRVQEAAGSAGVAGYTDFDAFLDDVEVVTFSVPPPVQASLATSAAAEGKHLLLEKPIALDVAAARLLEDAVVRAGVKSAVFFTACYTFERRRWVEELRASSFASGAWAVWLASAFAPGSPFDTPWRRTSGALWDIGPHVLAALTDALGPITQVVSATRGEKDVVHLVLEHETGATSTATLTLQAEPVAGTAEVSVWGADGVRRMPHSAEPVETTLARALSELMACAADDTTHRLDVSFGRHVVELLAEAERLAGAEGSGAHPSPS